MVNIFEFLSKKYPSGEYALLQEVSDAAGFGRSRSADYVVMNLWPSRGLHLSGIELKSSRTDWLRELKNPRKAENIFKYCDFFWLLTEGEDVAKIEEIPQTWGWMCLKGTRIVTLKEAPKLNPELMTRSFLACLLKRASDKSDWVHKSDIHDRIEDAKKQGTSIADVANQRALNELKAIQEKVDEFEKASGIDLKTGKWSYGDQKRIGEVVKHLSERGSVEELKKEFEKMESNARILHERIQKSIQVFNGM